MSKKYKQEGKHQRICDLNDGRSPRGSSDVPAVAVAVVLESVQLHQSADVFAIESGIQELQVARNAVGIRRLRNDRDLLPVGETEQCLLKETNESNAEGGESTHFNGQRVLLGDGHEVGLRVQGTGVFPQRCVCLQVTTINKQ